MHPQDNYFMKFIKHIFTKHRNQAFLIIGFIVILLLIRIFTVSFATPGGPNYSPGETLDPVQAPGTSVVDIPWTTAGTDIYYNLGKVGIGTTSPTNDLSFGGDADRTIWVERRTTSTPPTGKNLTIQAGGTMSGNLNKNGGSLSISGGISTGTGSSTINFLTAPSGSSGTTDNTPTTKMTILGNGIVGIGTGSATLGSGLVQIGDHGVAPCQFTTCDRALTIMKTLNSGNNDAGIFLSPQETVSATSFDAMDIFPDIDVGVNQTVAKGIEISPVNNGTITTWYGMHISPPTGAGTITNNYDAVFNGGGNVGMGTDTPTANLHILNHDPANTLTRLITENSNAAGTSIIKAIAGSVVGFLSSVGSTGTVDIGAESSNPFRLIVDNSQTMAIDPSGNVGIGIANPTRAMSIGGNLLNDNRGVVRLEPRSGPPAGSPCAAGDMYMDSNGATADTGPILCVCQSDTALSTTWYSVNIGGTCS